MYKKKNFVIGIDFGTTYCLTSYINHNKLYIVSDRKNRNCIPTIINFQKKNIKVGWTAKKKQKNDPTNTITSIKRFIGLSLKEIKEKYPKLPYKIKENKDNQLIFYTKVGKINITFIIKKIFQSLIKKIKKINNQIIYEAVITVPAYFNNIQKNEIRKAANCIKLKILRLLSEPTAAAIAYGLEKKKEGIFCIYDLGGGTFDVCILKISNGIFEVLSTNGNCSLGGDDFDILLANFLCKKLNISKKLNHQEFKKLLIKSEKAKIQLTTKNKVTINFLCKKYICTVYKFNKLINPLIQETIEIVNKSILDANLLKNKINDIILVGGSTYIPLVQNTIKKYFNRKPLCSINPTEVVVRGAGLHAYFLKNKNKNIYENSILLLDVLPISIGMELIGGIMEKMILKNTTLPIEISKIFTTFKDNQTGFCINIYQGEKKYVKDCQFLTKFKIKNLPKKNAGKIKILITFQIDVDGLLNISVQEKNLRIQKTIKIDTIYNSNNTTIFNIKNK